MDGTPRHQFSVTSGIPAGVAGHKGCGLKIVGAASWEGPDAAADRY